MDKKDNRTALSVGVVNQKPMITVIPPSGGLRTWLSDYFCG